MDGVVYLENLLNMPPNISFHVFIEFNGKIHMSDLEELKKTISFMKRLSRSTKVTKMCDDIQTSSSHLTSMHRFCYQPTFHPLYIPLPKTTDILVITAIYISFIMREHAKTLNIEYLLVVVNKMNNPTVAWFQERYITAVECISLKRLDLTELLNRCR
jgi:hypothetical protein